MKTEHTTEEKAAFRAKMEEAQRLAIVMTLAMQPECKSPAIGALAALILAAGASAAAGIPAHVAVATFVGLYNDSQRLVDEMPSTEVH